MKRTSVILAIVIVCGTIVSGAYAVRALYLAPQDRPWIRRVVTRLPIPIARVGSQYVRYEEYLAQRDATRAFLRSPVARGQGLPTEIDVNAERAILNQLVRVAAVQEMAKTANLALRAGEVDRMYQDLLGRAGTSTEPGEVAAYLQSTFGWSEQTFKERVVRPAVLETVVKQEMYKGDEAAFEKALQDKIGKARNYIRL